jgi:hypothetical protein
MILSSIKEYREWVHDSVGRGVLTSLAAIGVGGSAIIFGASWT